MVQTISVSDKSNLKPSASSDKRKAFVEGGHQLEKLEFALAISDSKGDKTRSKKLRKAIKSLGGNLEEPGT